MTTPQETIAAAILAELRAQMNSDENKGDIGWIDSENGTDQVVLDGRFNLDRVGEALLDAELVLVSPEATWRCFHCDGLFYSEHAARAHFGPHEGRTPACQIKASEGGLVRALREAEEEAEKAWSVVHSEGADGLQAWRGAMSRNHQAVVSAEETGYERGIRDQAKTVENLRRALAWHGDLARMATTRESWQQDVDEAIRWVKDNPEEGLASFPTLVQQHVDLTEASIVDHPAVRR